MKDLLPDNIVLLKQCEMMPFVAHLEAYCNTSPGAHAPFICVHCKEANHHSKDCILNALQPSQSLQPTRAKPLFRR